MSLFIDKQNRRKSPFALAVFGAALLDFGVFALMYDLLAEPLYYAVAFTSPVLTVAAHGLVIALAGTAVSCLLFFLPDKRIVPCGFAGLGIILGMFCAAALLLEPEVRVGMLWLIGIYGLPPVLVGSAVTWPVYLKLRGANPAPRQRKTIQQELLDAAAQEAAKRERKRARQMEKNRASGVTAEPEKIFPPQRAPEAPGPSPEEALFGPQTSGGPGSFLSEEEEAMLLFMDEDGDEETDD